MSQKDVEKGDAESVSIKEADTRVEPQSRKIHFDTGEEHLRYRKNWWQLWLPKDPPPPPPESLDDASVIPLATASIFSMLSYTWITPIMTLGYQRTLQATDLWKLDSSRECGPLGDRLDEAWARRVKEAQEWNARLEKGEIRPPVLKRAKWTFQALRNRGSGYSEKRAALERQWLEHDGRKEASLAWALNDTLGLSFWLGGLFKVLGDTSQLMGPILVKAIINFGKEHFAAKEAGEPLPNIGRGIGMAIGLFCVTVMASVCTHQFFWRSMTTGLLARAALISSIYKRGIYMTGKARTNFPNSALVNHISTDVSRVDACAQWFVIICLIILLVQLGPSALAGFALFLVLIPLQERLMSIQLRIRKEANRWTDQRAKIILEVLGAMRVVKYFSYEVPFLQRIFETRKHEMKGIRSIQFARSANLAFAFSIPVLAATLAFVTYTSTNSDFNVAVIFSSFSLFQLLSSPHVLPRALSATTDAQNALISSKSSKPSCEGESFTIDPSQKLALEVRDATFEWEETLSAKEAKEARAKSKKGKDKELAAKDGAAAPKAEGPPFQVRNVDMLIPEARLGRISCSASYSMRKGQECQYWKAVEDASLVTDLQVLADGDLTEIGEKGINLSGGQKQRVNIARALYHDADVVLFDDPLSLVMDAHVGRALFSDAILGALRNRGKTVILVTHALHFLSQIAAQGKYDDLFGGEEKHEEEAEAEEEAMEQKPPVQATIEDAKSKSESKRKRLGAGSGKLEGRLMVSEKRTTGSVGWNVYGAYFSAGKASLTVPFVVIFLLLMQGSSIMNSYTLVWWQANTFNRPNWFYQVLYACMGVSQAIFTLLVGVSMDEMAYFVSKNLHNVSIHNIFYAPMSFFDTTPAGRILSVFGKDIDIALTIANVIGAVVIVTVLEHYFLIAAVFIAFGYQYLSAFYRSSAREMKRIDSMLRSFLYAHFAESLSYGVVDRFLQNNMYYTDLEDRAAFLTVTTKGMMTFVVGILAVVGVSGINPAQIGLVLTYTTSLTQICSMLTRQSAEVENYMASVETVTHYSHGGNIAQEAPHEIKDTQPPPEWPEHGAIEFNEIAMRYRPGLPLVLKGLSLSIRGGEKIGVVGRTGAGKSSLMLALFRIVELTSGTITVDGVDISKIGLRDLRKKIAIIPQDVSTCTIRSNLDPFSMYDDAQLWDALRRSYLVDPITDDDSEKDGLKDQNKSRYTLDSTVESDGANLSVGERSLLSLARALVKDSKVVASVDLETDSKIQHTIQTQFRDKTLLCIAHRLRTIISYDRILVLDAGSIAEFDTPENLYIRNGIFRGMCERSNISLDDINKAALKAQTL
ncbi:ABC protein [Irpex lacteus]|nr:ABC protein [Irpex lacteus]